MKPYYEDELAKVARRREMNRLKGIRWRLRKSGVDVPFVKPGVPDGYRQTTEHKDNRRKADGEAFQPIMPKNPRECTSCGQQFVPETGGQRRCNECRTQACGYCGKHFFSEWGHSQKFCSLRCASLGHPEATQRIIQKRGNKPRTYHLRQDRRRGCAFDRDWRKQVFERDDFTCQECGLRGVRLEAHHIKPYMECPDMRYELSNGVTLCSACHRKTESYGFSKYWAAKRQAANRCRQTVMQFDAPAAQPEQLALKGSQP